MSLPTYLSAALAIVAISIPHMASSETGQTELISFDRQTTAKLVLQDETPVEIARCGRFRG